tara:strand:- start:2249 stop:2512 length:264 start_codon:yes stop_codon:yes gene_type:complete
MKIQDETLEPYEIVMDGSNYSVEQKSDKLNKEGDLITKNQGYFTSLYSAIGKIISLKLISSNKSVTLKEFILEYTSIKNEIKNSIGF